MSKKIFRSIIAVAMVVLVSCLFIASSFLYDYFNKSQVTQLKEELSLVATNVDKVGTEYFDNFDSSVFRFTLVSADGSVLYDSQAKAEDMENHLEREEIAEALESGNGSRVTADLAYILKPEPRLRKPNYEGFYKDKSFISFYAGVENSEGIITKAHKLRNANPLSHSSSELLDDNNTSAELQDSIKALSKLIYDYVDSHKN